MEKLTNLEEDDSSILLYSQPYISQIHNLYIMRQRKHWPELREQLIQLRQQSFDLAKWWEEEEKTQIARYYQPIMSKTRRKMMQMEQERINEKGNEKKDVIKNPMNNGKECIVCYYQKIEYANKSCGHLCLGAKCAAQMNFCPICKASGDFLKIFDAV